MHSARPDENNPPILRWSGCEGTTDMRPSLFVGAYTAVTKSLWQKALQTRGTPSRDAELPSIVDKEPQVTTVEYPFTQDREFCEMVRSKLQTFVSGGRSFQPRVPETSEKR
jgi:hypothetical protein